MRGHLISALGVILAALSKPCCVLPMLLSLFGLSSSSLVGPLYPYRVILLSSSLLAFSLSAFLTFRSNVSFFSKGLWFIAVSMAVWLWFWR